MTSKKSRVRSWRPYTHPHLQGDPVNRFIALCYFVLSLYGCDVGSSTSVYRAQDNGSDVLYSKVVTQAGIARFDCVRSASGTCHYRVFSRECPSTPTADSSQTPAARCATTPIRRFAIANGDSRMIPGLQTFSVCVSAEDGTSAADCGVPEPVAAR